MVTSPVALTDEARFFLEPASPGQRQYEALRAYFVEQLSTEEVARRFGYTPGSFRVLCHHFWREKPDWFRELKRGPRSPQIFRHFLDTPAQIDIQQNRIEVTLPKRAHNPLLIATGYGDKTTPVPWWDNHRLALKFR